MDDITIGGIDPGIIHTGCVAITLDEAKRTIDIRFEIINGVDISKTQYWVNKQGLDALFIEDYNPGNYTREDKKMSEALGRLKSAFIPTDDPIVRYVDNAGINTLIPIAVLRCFGVDKFPVSTNHNDLVSAAKIALLGMLKDKSGLRLLVSRVVRDHLTNRAWKVTLHA